MKLLDSGFATTCCWVRRLLLFPHCPTLATTLRHFFPLCALIVDSFANMSCGIVLEMENICGNTEAREDFLWSLQRKPQLLGDAAETTHSASPHVAEKNPKCFVTVNSCAEFPGIPCSSQPTSCFHRRRTVAGRAGQYQLPRLGKAGRPDLSPLPGQARSGPLPQVGGAAFGNSHGNEHMQMHTRTIARVESLYQY